jgi:dTDP-4-amino-4,6-dideoxygalactose transaminase
MNDRRKELVIRYMEELDTVSWLQVPDWDENSSWHLFVLRIAEEKRNLFIDYLLSKGISAGVHYKPLNTYPIFPNTPLPVTDRVWKTLVTIPLFADLTDDEQTYIIKTIKDFDLAVS